MTAFCAALPRRDIATVEPQSLLATAIATLLGAGWLTQWQKNRGALQGRHADELAEVRRDLGVRIDKLEQRLERADVARDGLRQEVFHLKLSYAVFRQKVRTLIVLARAGDARFEAMAADIEDDTHEVDDLLEGVNIERRRSPDGGPPPDGVGERRAEATP